jgi:hypothetical protein
MMQQENVIMWLREQRARSAVPSDTQSRISTARRAFAAIQEDECVAITCADCGCVVERGVVLVRCADPECCCRDLPDQERT